MLQLQIQALHIIECGYKKRNNKFIEAKPLKWGMLRLCPLIFQYDIHLVSNAYGPRTFCPQQSVPNWLVLQDKRSPTNSVPMDKWSSTNLVPLDKWSLKYSVCPRGQADRIWKYGDQIGWGPFVQGDQIGLGPFVQGDQVLGDHLSMGTKFVGDHLSRGTKCVAVDVFNNASKN